MSIESGWIIEISTFANYPTTWFNFIIVQSQPLIQTVTRVQGQRSHLSVDIDKRFNTHNWTHVNKTRLCRSEVADLSLKVYPAASSHWQCVRCVWLSGACMRPTNLSKFADSLIWSWWDCRQTATTATATTEHSTSIEPIAMLTGDTSTFWFLRLASWSS